MADVDASVSCCETSRFGGKRRIEKKLGSQQGSLRIADLWQIFSLERIKMEDHLIQFDPHCELPLADDLYDCTSLQLSESSSLQDVWKDLEGVPNSTEAEEIEDDATIPANIPGQIVCITKAEGGAQESDAIKAQQDVYLFAEFIDARNKRKRLADFISQFNSCFETEEGRLALTNLHPDLAGSTPAEVAARFHAKHGGESGLQS